jgi:HlyD family secretion protein
MDRDLPQTVIQKEKGKNWLMLVLAAVLVVAGMFAVRSVFSTTLKKSEIRTSVAETGSVENTLTATGEIQPEFEQLITSPISAAIQHVFLSEGSPVKAGEKIMELDKALTQIDFEKQKDQLELKRNGIVKLRLELDKSFYDLKISDSIKAFRIEALKADIENARRLFKAGGGTREAVDKLENDLHIARLEKRQLENDIRNRQAVTQAGIRETEISASIQEKELRAFEQKLQKADIRADHPGVLTWVNKNLGQKVGEGEALARVADLGSYKVLASISDNYAERLQTGMPVVVRINDAQMPGILTNIHPSIANNVVHFDVALDHKNAGQLRPKMKVEVYLVTDRRAQTIRVANGPAFKGGSDLDLFVLRPDGMAERRRVKTGLSNFDFVEILEGIAPGETVIVSDLSKYKNSKEIKVEGGR